MDLHEDLCARLFLVLLDEDESKSEGTGTAAESNLFVVGVGRVDSEDDDDRRVTSFWGLAIFLSNLTLEIPCSLII